MRSRLLPAVFAGIEFLAILVAGGTPSAAVEPPAEVASLTAAQRLALEQIDQLLAADAVDEVVPLVVRTIDEAEGRMVAAPPAAEFESDFAHYVPLRMFLQDRLLRWGQSHPEVLRLYRERTDPAARVRLESARQSRRLEQAIDASEAILATSYGDDSLLLVADLALERGWAWTAIGALRRIDPRWQAHGSGKPAATVAAVGWEMWLPRISQQDLEAQAEVVQRQTAHPTGWPLGCYHGSDLPQPEIGLRLVHAYLLAGERQTAVRLAVLIGHWFPDQQVSLRGVATPVAKAATELIESAEQWPAAADRTASSTASAWSTVGGDASRVYRTPPLVDLPLLPTWVRPIEPSGAGPAATGPAAANRELRPTEPPIGDSGMSPADSLPIIHAGLVLLPTHDSIHAFDLANGASWPPAADEADPGSPAESAAAPTVEPAPIFRGGDSVDPSATAAELPLDGEPRFTLSADQGRVAGRFGPVQSGWLAVVRPRQPQSRVALIDLHREGQLVDGYPLRASEIAAPSTVEFEGAPLIVGRRMYVGVAERDDATLTSSVLCIDVASGEELFRTPLIGSARPISTEPRNRVGQCLVSYREGVVYYHGDSGAVAGIDAEDGSLHWVTRYPRAELGEGGYPRRRRSARIQLSGVAVLGPLAIVAAADSDRLFAVDPLDGRLLWATAPGEADDVDQILGEVDGKILAGGDSLYWVDRQSGVPVAVWPAGVTDQPTGGLPRPRRNGRALLAGREVYWPTADAIWVLDGGLAPGAGLVRPLRRIDLRAAGLRGGNLAAAEGILVMASADTLAAFAGRFAYTDKQRGVGF